MPVLSTGTPSSWEVIRFWLSYKVNTSVSVTKTTQMKMLNEHLSLVSNMYSFIVYRTAQKNVCLMLWPVYASDFAFS